MILENAFFQKCINTNYLIYFFPKIRNEGEII